MINKVRICLLSFLLLSVSSCSGWDPYDNPIENRVKKTRDFFVNLNSKNKLKYSIINPNYERNRADYYKESLDKFLEKNFDREKESTVYTVKIDLDDKNKGVLVKEIYEKISKYCVSDANNFPSFHKKAKDENVIKHLIIFNQSSQSSFEEAFNLEGIGDYVGGFSCFKKNIGYIWKVKIDPRLKKTQKEALITISSSADYTNTKRKRKGRHRTIVHE